MNRPTTKVKSYIQYFSQHKLFTGMSLVQIQRWLMTPRKEWVGLTPLQVIHAGRISAVVALLDRLESGEVSST